MPCTHICLFSYVFRRLRKLAKNDYYLRHVMPVCPPARVQQLGSHWPDFDEIWYVLLLNLSEKVSLKSGKHKGCFT
jgi:hypothetical protein